MMSFCSVFDCRWSSSRVFVLGWITSLYFCCISRHHIKRLLFPLMLVGADCRFGLSSHNSSDNVGYEWKFLSVFYRAEEMTSLVDFVFLLTTLHSFRGSELRSLLRTSILSIAMRFSNDSGNAVSLFSFTSNSSCSYIE